MDALEKRRAELGRGRRTRDGEGEIEKGQSQRACRRFEVRKDSAADAEEIENYKREIGTTS